jgi:uncharacterized protein
MTATYVDASALVKLVVEESETPAMHRWLLEATRVLTSRVGVIETNRAIARRGTYDTRHRDAVLRDIEVIEVDAGIATAASGIGPPTLRTLDAIHLASALSILPELDAFVTYDDRLAEAARAIGLPVMRPA